MNITSTQAMELLCIDFLSLERSKDGHENILVNINHFTRYAQAFPTRNQLANTKAKILFKNFIVHYGFPARIHSDQGRNFESSHITELCGLAGFQKSQTTPYYPMGNGMVEIVHRGKSIMILRLRIWSSSIRVPWAMSKIDFPR